VTPTVPGPVSPETCSLSDTLWPASIRVDDTSLEMRGGSPGAMETGFTALPVNVIGSASIIDWTGSSGRRP
jgi:hypothetical protein